jgi:sugar phosphate isomerase/epimerase
MDLASIPVEQFVNVHLNDAPNIPREQQQDQVRLLPGESGVIDIVGFMKTLDAIGFDGPLSVETFSEELRALPAEEAAARDSSAVAQVLNAAGVTPVRLL